MINSRFRIVALAVSVAMSFLGSVAHAATFSGTGPTGCTDKRCWLTARQNAFNSCKASGCHQCTISAAAWDQCVFNNGYTCTSTCQDAPVCASAPTVTASVTPGKIWPPNKKMVALTLSGTVTNPTGCTLTGAAFTLTDEYGANQAAPLTLGANGSFSATVYVQAWRNGSDIDGRSYSFAASATNQAGTGVSNAAVSTVLHSQR